jgi:hypothetical protein
MPGGTVSASTRCELWCPTDRFLAAFRYESERSGRDEDADDRLPDCDGAPPLPADEVLKMKKSIALFALYWEKPYRYVPLPDGSVMLVFECKSARELRIIDIELDWIHFRLVWLRRRLSEQLGELARVFLRTKAAEQLRDAAEQYAHSHRHRLTRGGEKITTRDAPQADITVDNFVTEARAKGVLALASWRHMQTAGAVLIAIEACGAFATRAMNI